MIYSPSWEEHLSSLEQVFNCVCAFNAAKDLSCNAPVLSVPNFTLPFKLHVDTGSTGAGAVLIWEDAYSGEYLMCYFSKKFSKYQQRYSTIKKEASISSKRASYQLAFLRSFFP